MKINPCGCVTTTLVCNATKLPTYVKTMYMICAMRLRTLTYQHLNIHYHSNNIHNPV